VVGRRLQSWADRVPLAVQIAAFLAMAPDEQLEYFDQPLPENRGGCGAPLDLLLNAIGTSLTYVFDYLDAADGLSRRVNKRWAQDLFDAAQAVAMKDSREDFVAGPEWQHLRRLCARLLDEFAVAPVVLPKPIPLRSWTYHHIAVPES
jgi:hypothetical protein